MTILLIGIGAVHCLVLLVLATELVIERRLNAALADRNAVQAQALAMWRAKFPGRRLMRWDWHDGNCLPCLAVCIFGGIAGGVALAELLWWILP
jgi:hypothetical protein